MTTTDAEGRSRLHISPSLRPKGLPKRVFVITTRREMDHIVGLAREAGLGDCRLVPCIAPRDITALGIAALALPIHVAGIEILACALEDAYVLDEPFMELAADLCQLLHQPYHDAEVYYWRDGDGITRKAYNRPSVIR